MTEEQYEAYFEALATKNKFINHNVEGSVAFAYISEPDELENFDELLRSATSDVFMLLVASDGSLTDNRTSNHVKNIEGQLYIVMRTGNDLTQVEARAQSFDILLGVLVRVKQDAKNEQIIPGKTIHFPFDDIPYQKVGPMNGAWFGYTALVQFGCPFGYTIDSGTWTDK